MTCLHPRGVNHLAISTRDMKGQLAFWSDVLGCPLKALYWMHGAEDTFHGFVELAPDSYVAFVQHPDNPKDIEYGITHAGNPGGLVTVGTMQHVAFHVDSLDDVLAMRDRIRSRQVQVLGPIDHGFVQSIYFAGPEGLNLEICCGSDIDERAWIDPEVVGLCELTPDEIAALKDPPPFLRPAEPVPQPPTDPARPQLHFPPGVYEVLSAMSDQQTWESASQPTPPVVLRLNEGDIE
jgi:catechol 2,3-dioxygenase-like lactoylglutathione lyase family enzyme